MLAPPPRWNDRRRLSLTTDLPRVPESAFTERIGVAHVESVVASARCVWRELLLRDVGIDGQIEYVDSEGHATGRMVAVQVKTGESYFRAGSDSAVELTIERRHLEYWDRFSTPVILVLVDPRSMCAIWVDARSAIRDAQASPLAVPRTQLFDAAGVRLALSSDGPLPAGPIPLDELVAKIMGPGPYDLSYLDLLCHGLTDHPAWQVYFGMDLFSELIDVRASVDGWPSWSVGQDEYRFIDEYAAFLVGQHIARVDFDHLARVTRNHGLVGRFLAPLSPRGLDLIRFIAAADDDLSEHEGPYSRAVQDRPLRLDLLGIEDKAARMAALKVSLKEAE